MYENFNNNDILAAGGLKMILDLKQIDKETADRIELLFKYVICQQLNDYRQYIITGGQNTLLPGFVRGLRISALYFDDQDLQKEVSKFLDEPNMKNLEDLIRKLDESIAKKQLDKLLKKINISK
ncbi:MAG: hypothetical protein IKA25_03565 [Alphaproteobacteria bacterium]|nr:hypothetical protein [Alphaproteobacteria bacterium]